MQHKKLSILIILLLILILPIAQAILLTYKNMFSYGVVTYPEHFSKLTIRGSFWFDSYGNPVFLRGVIYTWHYGDSLFGNDYKYKPAEVDGNLTAIKEAGFNLVGIHFGMIHGMPREGEYSQNRFDKLIDFLTRCREKELYVLIRSPDYAGPSSWVYERWRKTDWVFNQTFINEQKWFLWNLTKTIVENDLQDIIVGFDLWSEAEKRYNFRGIWDYDLDSEYIIENFAEQRWQRWLRRRYNNSLELLNKTWKTSPLNRIENFDEIPFPSISQCQTYYSAVGVDYAKFMVELWYNLTKVRNQAVKKYYNFSCTASASAFMYRIPSGDHTTQSFIAVEQIADIVDFISVDPYHPELGDLISLATYNRRWNKPMLAMEYGCGGKETSNYTLEDKKTYWVRSYQQLLSQGISASLIWAWQDPEPSSPSYGYGLCDKHGNPKPILSLISKINQEVKLCQRFMDKALYDPKIAVIYSMTSILGDSYGYSGRAALLPMAFAAVNIYPTAIYEGPNRTYWDKKLFKADWNLTYLGSFRILAYDYIHYQHTNSTWWNKILNQSINKHNVKLIAQGLPGMKANGGLGGDEYGQTCYEKLDWNSWFPISSYTYDSFGTGVWYQTNGSYVWGPFKGENFSYYHGDGAYFAKNVTLNPNSTVIGVVTIGGKNYSWIIANDKVFWLGSHRQEARMFMSFTSAGSSPKLLYDVDDQKKIPTALAWFGYIPRFNVTNKYITCQIFNITDGAAVIFGNDASFHRTFTFHITNITDYEIKADSNYMLYWLHNNTYVEEFYTGLQLRNGIKITVENYTIASLLIVEINNKTSFLLFDNNLFILSLLLINIAFLSYLRVLKGHAAAKVKRVSIGFKNRSWNIL